MAQGVSWETLGLTVAGWLVGLASALLLDSVRGTRRLRGVAKALLEEVRRIGVELGTWGGFSDVQIAGATSVVPMVHDAVKRLYPESAAIEPEVLGCFFALERFLGNMAAFQVQARRGRERLAEFGDVDEAVRSADDRLLDLPDAELIDQVVQEATARHLEKQERDQVRDFVDMAARMFEGSQRYALDELDRIEELLDHYLAHTRLIEQWSIRRAPRRRPPPARPTRRANST